MNLKQQKEMLDLQKREIEEFRIQYKNEPSVSKKLNLLKKINLLEETFKFDNLYYEERRDWNTKSFWTRIFSSPYNEAWKKRYID